MTELFAAIPWIVLLIVYLGETVKQWLLTKALNDALKRAQSVVVPQVIPVPQVAPVPAPVVKPAGPFADAPKWFQWALHEIGAHEETSNRGAAVRRYISLAHCGTEGDPWCAIFANAALESSGVAGSRSPSSQSFRANANFVQLSAPALGAIAVFWRGQPDSGLGHVGFYRGEDAKSVWTLGGNENDMVQIEALPKSSASFGLIGYWWPKGVPMPQTGAVIMPAGSPVNVQTPPDGAAPVPQSTSTKQAGITATMFGGEQSAYGGAIDDNKPGVALPFRFSETPRPRVRVTKGSASVDCDIVDVGPWNINDPYWQTSKRPEAESGTDSRGRKTNRAGIDLTVAAAKAIQLDGKGLCDWEFIEPPATTTVT